MQAKEPRQHGACLSQIGRTPGTVWTPSSTWSSVSEFCSRQYSDSMSLRCISIPR